MVQATLTTQTPYFLGHTQSELARLIDQARFFGELTAQVLHSAGIGSGMRVLDVGCGPGDVSFLAASLVGPEGVVIGVDKAADATSLATQRAAAAKLTNVHFVTEDLINYRSETLFDALIGSKVLMYFTDPAVLLRSLVEFVRPGGVIAFQEFDLEGAKSEPVCPLFELSLARLRQTFTLAGSDIRAGLKLAQIFEEAGLPAPKMIQGARVEWGADSELCDQVAGVSRALLPLMERTGVATAANIDVDTLATRLRGAAANTRSTFVSPPLIGAWTRKVAKR